MKYLLLSLLLISQLFITAKAIALPTPQHAPTPHVTPSAPTISAETFLLMDFNSGHILASKNADARVEPASLTKIMTGFVVFHELINGNIELTDQVSISKKAWRMPGSKMFIEVGKKVSVEHLIKGMVIQSGNDASVALAEHIAGSEEVFVKLMNKHAKSLGMNNTNFVNSTGLPHPDHYTTAQDLSILTQQLITQFPEKYKWYSQRKFTFNGITQFNRNRLLWQDKTVDGLKTGHTSTAGYCLISSAERNEMRLINIILGANSSTTRIRESQKLLNYGFRFFETHKIYSGMQRLNDARVWEGTRNTVGLGVIDDLFITIPRGQYKNLKIESSIKPSLTAPISQLQPLGELTISLNDEVITSQTIVALSDIEEGSFFKKIMDQLKQLINSFFQIFD